MNLIKDGLFQVLTQARQECRVCVHSSPGLIVNGSERTYDPKVPSHWSQWLCDPNPELVIVGQDFGNLAYFDAFLGKDDPRNETNMQLYEFLQIAGFRPGRPVVRDDQSQIYLTNSVLCFKTSPKMNAPIKQQWAKNCIRLHLEQLLLSLKPKVVVAMGGTAWVELRRHFKLKHAPEQITKVTGQSFQTERFQIFPVVHCGRLGQVSRAGALQREDWHRIGVFLGRR